MGGGEEEWGGANWMTWDRRKWTDRITGSRRSTQGYTSDLLQMLTPSLPGCHLKATNKSAKFETLKPF